MTSLCKFGHGNSRLARVVLGTVIGATQWLELPSKQICRRQRKRTQCSTERSEWEGRDCCSSAKAITVSASELPVYTLAEAASPVSRWSHAEKAIVPNLGDRPMSRAVIQSDCCWMVLVAPPISSLSERVGEASCGVGGASTIDDVKDSTTLTKRRSPACVHDRSEFKDESILRNRSKR
jgi:hypothetical protein